MKKSLFFTSLFVLFTLFSCKSLDERRGFSIEDVPNVHLQDAHHFISDPKEYLNPSEKKILNQAIAQISQNDQIEIAVVLIPKIDATKYGSHRDFANRLFEKWGIGNKGSNRGLLILHSVEDRNYTFEVGYGLEGELTDARSKIIQTHRMIPYAKKGHYATALMEGLKEIHQTLNKSNTLPLKEKKDLHKKSQKEKPSLFGFLLFAIIIIVLLFTIGPRGVLLLLLSLGGRRGGGFGGGSWGGGSSGGGGASSSY